jgi:hypothetical protein
VRCPLRGAAGTTRAVGADGKQSPAGFVIPDFIEEAELEQCLFDLFHESAAGFASGVQRID